MKGHDEKGYYSQCDGCGSKFYGYDDLDTWPIDDNIWCHDCAQRRGFVCISDDNKHWFARKDIYRIAPSFSSLYDGPGEYFISLDWVIKKKGPISKVVHCPRGPMFLNWGYGLSGYINSEHYEVHLVEWDEKRLGMFAFVFEPSEDEMKKIRPYLVEKVKE